jgi:hypothetical protein
MTSKQIEKLKELGELLTSGVISEVEFNSLKTDLLKQNFEQQEPSSAIKSENAKKIRLKGFHGADSQFVSPPQIAELDIDNISKEDEKKLKAFLRLKQIFCPYEMTQDEIEIGSKLFSQLEIEKINSERPGLNFSWAVIISVLASGFAFFLMYISPCFGFLGAGTGMASATFISLYVLTRVSATKLDRILSVLAILLSIGAFLAYLSHFD